MNFSFFFVFIFGLVVTLQSHYSFFLIDKQQRIWGKKINIQLKTDRVVGEAWGKITA
jgi:hypothetical protein